MEGLGINWKILLGQIINFVILLYLLKRFAYKPFLNILEKRKARIEEGIAKSDEVEKSLQRIEELSKKVKDGAEIEARAIVKDAEVLAQTKSKEVLLSTEKEQERLIETAKKRIEEESLKEKEKTEREVVQRTFLLAEKFLGKKIDEEKDKKFIEELFAKIR